MMKFLLMLFLLAGSDRVSAASVETPPAGTIKVAFALSANANVMDIAGPWEVFQDTVPDGGMSLPLALTMVEN